MTSDENDSRYTLNCWTNSLTIQPLNNETHDNHEERKLKINILSFNILAESYLTPGSHQNLPDCYANVVFNKEKRRELLCDTIKKLAEIFDILCLQEVDHFLHPLLVACLKPMGFGFVYYPRGNNATPILSDDCIHLKDEKHEKLKNKILKDARSDGCATFYKLDKWSCVDYDIVQFDDLADDSRTSLLNVNSDDNNNMVKSKDAPKYVSSKTSLPGIISSYRRRNAAVIIRLKHKLSPQVRLPDKQQEVIVANTHLYWHPGYEFVKLSQAHYLLQRIQYFVNKAKGEDNKDITTSTMKQSNVIICGDMNSKPNSAVHQYFTKGNVDARSIAPWNYYFDESEEEQYSEGSMNDNSHDQDPIIEIEENNVNDFEVNNNDVLSRSNEEELTKSIADIVLCQPCNEDETKNLITSNNISTPRKLPSYQEASDVIGSATPRYLLDITLNKLTRWLRILGIDAELESGEEEKARTSNGQTLLFERCKKEKRSLITTSKTLLKRKECPPGTYLVNPRTIKDLEASLVHLLLLHAVTLQPRKFLTICVVCNGTIIEVHDTKEKKAIFVEFGFPGFDEDLDVYKCCRCGQGYWWSDAPQSSASRVKDTAAHLLRICVRGGIPTEGNLDFFDFVNIEEERVLGEQERMNESKGGVDEVISWLRDEKLGHDFKLQSAYALEHKNGNIDGELLPFTNVTSNFVGALDYILFDETAFQQNGRLFVPSNFTTLNWQKISNGHLIPSDVWPSDHLAIGATLILNEEKNELTPVDNQQNEILNEDKVNNDNISKHLSPQLGCSCGCVPKVMSLFQMAELRKQARLAKRESN